MLSFFDPERKTMPHIARRKQCEALIFWVFFSCQTGQLRLSAHQCAVSNCNLSCGPSINLVMHWNHTVIFSNSLFCGFSKKVSACIRSTVARACWTSLSTSASECRPRLAAPNLLTYRMCAIELSRVMMPHQNQRPNQEA